MLHLRIAAAVVLAVGLAGVSARGEDRPTEKKLDGVSASMKEKAPGAVKVVDEGVAEIEASGIVKNAPKVGDEAELFELPDASGKIVKLSELLQKGPVVLSWYRGGWCPYCNIELHGLVEAEPKIRELGATLVAISPETPDYARETIKANQITFPVLSDKGNLVARKYRIAYKVPAKLSAMMKTHKVDLETRNGDASDELPLAVTYVIGSDGKIAWAFVSADHRKRAEPADVVAALERMKKQ